MKTKIISIAIGATVFVVSNIFGYNVYKNANNQNAENLKLENTESNFVQYADDVDEKKEVIKEMTENSAEELTNPKSEDDVNSQNNGKNGGTNITNTYTYNENKTSNTENKQVNANQNNEYNINDNKPDESKNTSQNTEQKKSVSKFTVSRCGDESIGDEDGMYIDEVGLPVGDVDWFGVGSAKFLYSIDFDLNNKTASVKMDILENKSGKITYDTEPDTFNLTDFQVECLLKIYEGNPDIDSAEYDEIYYQVESEEYVNDCNQIFVTSDDEVEFLDKFIYEFWHPGITANN